jgi:poly(A) polymerase
MDPEEKIRLVKDAYGVIKFRPKGNSLPELVDIAFPRSDDYSGSGQAGILGIKRDMEPKADPSLSISEDLERRDLTINAMAVNLMDGEIIDPFDGVEDIVKRRIRTAGDPEERILKEDLSRGFRAIRFACSLGFDIEHETKQAVKKIFHSTSQPSDAIYQDKPEILLQVKQYEKEVRSQFGIPEGPLPRCLQVFWDRVQEKPRMAVAKEVMSKEILKSLKADPKRFIELMDEIGGLEIILPEFTHLKNLAQPREFHREGDTFLHTMMVLEKLPSNASLRLILAAISHDFGKADTQKIDEVGKITFHGHASKSAEHVRDIAKRLRFSDKLKKEVTFLVENHMLPISSNIGQIKSNKLEKLFLEDEELGQELIELSRADALASIPEDGKPNLENIDLLVERIGQLKQLAIDKEKVIPYLVMGKDLIGLGLKPGPLFSRILEEVREAQLIGRINSKKEGLEFARKINNQ